MFENIRDFFFVYCNYVYCNHDKHTMNLQPLTYFILVEYDETINQVIDPQVTYDLISKLILIYLFFFFFMLVDTLCYICIMIVSKKYL